MVAQELLPNPLVVLARDDHPLARERNIPFERLAERAVPHPRGRLGRAADRDAAFGEHGLAPRIRMELGTNEAIKEAILAGLGITIMSRYTFGLDPESSRYLCLDVEGFPLENHWYFAYPEGKQLSPVARAFLDFARMEAKELVLGSWRGPRERRSGLRRADRDACRVSRTCARRRSPCRRWAARPARGTRLRRAAW